MRTTLTTRYRRTPEIHRDQLIFENVDFVARILSTMNFSIDNPEERENLRSAGIVGLVEAANSFVPEQGVAFRTFAYPRIRGAIIDELRKNSRVSQKRLKQIAQLRKAYEILEPPVSPEDLAQAADLTLDEVTTCLEAMRFIQPDNWNDLSDMVHGSWRAPADSPESEAELSELRELLASGIASLPEKERLVLTLYFAEEMSLAEIGAAMELSESRISRILALAKFKLQEIIRCKTN